MSTGWIIVLVIVGVAFIGGLLAALAVPAFQRFQKLAQEAKEKRHQAVQPPPPLTPAQQQAFEKFGAELAGALKKSDDVHVKRLLDTEAIADRVFDSRTDSIPQVGEVRKGFVEGAGKRQGGWLGDLLGADVKPLHFHTRDGFPAILLRIKPKDGGVNYVDVLARPDGESFRVVDMFGYLYATLISEEARRLIAVMIPNSGAGALASWLGVPNFDKAMLDHLQSATKMLREGRFAEALNLCQTLPEPYRSQRLFFIIRLEALMALNGTGEGKHDAAYKDALRAAPNILGQDSTTDLLMIDLHFLDGNFAEADASIQRVERIIGGDPYLKVLRANTRRMMKDYDGALKLANEAQHDEPDLADAVDARITIHLERKDYRGLVAELRAFKRDFGITLDRKALDEPMYAEFVASPEFAAWEKEIQK